MKSKRRIVFLACLAGVLCIGVILFWGYRRSHRPPLTPSEIDELAAALGIEIPRNRLWAVQARLDEDLGFGLYVRFDCSEETAKEIINSSWMGKHLSDRRYCGFTGPEAPWWDTTDKHGDQWFKNKGEPDVTALVRINNGKAVMYFERSGAHATPPGLPKIMRARWGRRGSDFHGHPWYEREWRKDQ